MFLRESTEMGSDTEEILVGVIEAQLSLIDIGDEMGTSTTYMMAAEHASIIKEDASAMISESAGFVQKMMDQAKRLWDIIRNFVTNLYRKVMEKIQKVKRRAKRNVFIVVQKAAGQQGHSRGHGNAARMREIADEIEELEERWGQEISHFRELESKVRETYEELERVKHDLEQAKDGNFEEKRKNAERKAADLHGKLDFYRSQIRRYNGSVRQVVMRIDELSARFEGHSMDGIAYHRSHDEVDERASDERKEKEDRLKKEIDGEE